MPVLVSEVRISDGDYSISTTPEKAMEIRDSLIKMFPCTPRQLTSCNNGVAVNLEFEHEILTLKLTPEQAKYLMEELRERVRSS